MIPSKLIKPIYPYQTDEMNKAHDEWGMNCGPGAFATMLNLTPFWIKPIFEQVDFMSKGYTNALMMMKALRIAKVNFNSTLTVSSGSPPDAKNFGQYTLCRIQWHGPWMNAGVPFRARFRYTHWVGAMTWANPWAITHIFDINAGWQTIAYWKNKTVPELTALYKRADGEWSITHRLELFV